MANRNGVGAFDIQSGFDVGRQMAGPNALGIVAKNILDQVNNIGGTVVTQKLLSPILAQRAGMEEEEKLKGMARFYQTPEAQSYLSGMSQRTQAMLGSMSGNQGVGGGATDGRQNSADLDNYTPQYGVTGATFDLLNPEATKYNIGETPQSQVRRKLAEDIGTKRKELEFGTQILNQHLGVIKDTLNKIPAVSEQSAGQLAAPLTTARGIFQRKMGAFAPRFQDAQSTIDASLGPFLTVVEGLARGRLTQGEINNLSKMIRDLPLLSESDRQRRFQLIDQLLIKGGVPVRFGGQSSPSQPSHAGQPDVSKMSDDELKSLIGQ